MRHLCARDSRRLPVYLRYLQGVRRGRARSVHCASTAVRIVPIPIGREEETSPRLVDRHDVLNGLELNEETVVDQQIHGVGLILEQKETKETKGIGKVVRCAACQISPRIRFHPSFKGCYKYKNSYGMRSYGMTIE